MGQTSDLATVSINMDSVVPARPTITSPAAGSSHGSTIAVSFRCPEAGAVVSLSSAYTHPRKATCVGTETQTVSLFTNQPTSVPSTPVTLVATDALGNESAVSTVNVAIDTIAETAPNILSPANGEQVTDPIVTSFRCVAANQTVVVENAFILPNGRSSHICTGAGDVTLSVDIWDPTNVPQSPLRLYSIDTNGNRSDPSEVLIDLRGASHPTPEFMEPAAKSLHSLSVPVTVSCIASGTTLNLSGPNVVSHSHTCTSSGNYSVDLEVRPGTEHISIISLSATDSQGFNSVKTLSVNLDNVAPSLPERFDNAAWVTSTSSTPMLSWSSSDSSDLVRYELAVGSSAGDNDIKRRSSFQQPYGAGFRGVYDLPCFYPHCGCTR